MGNSQPREYNAVPAIDIDLSNPDLALDIYEDEVNKLGSLRVEDGVLYLQYLSKIFTHEGEEAVIKLKCKIKEQGSKIIMRTSGMGYQGVIHITWSKDPKYEYQVDFRCSELWIANEIVSGYIKKSR